MIDIIKGIQPASWEKFADNLARIGYYPRVENPGLGAVPTIDEHSKAVILNCGAKTPAEYILAIHERRGIP